MNKSKSAQLNGKHGTDPSSAVALHASARLVNGTARADEDPLRDEQAP
jgi:hypothetical protein